MIAALSLWELSGKKNSAFDDTVASDDTYVDKSSIIMTVVSVVSMIFSLCGLLTAIIPRIREKPYMQVVLFIQACNLFTTIGTIPGYTKTGSSACYFQGFVTNIAPVSCVFWTVFLTIMLYYIVKSSKVIKITVLVHVVCWGFPLLLSVLPFINATYGVPPLTNGWCFIVPYDGSYRWTMFWYWFSYYAWLWSGIAINTMLSLRILILAQSMRSEASKEKILAIFNKLIMYPIIFTLCWFVSCVSDTIEAYGYHVRYYNVLIMISNFLSCVQGVLTTSYFFISNRDIFINIDRKNLLTCKGLISIVTVPSSSAATPQPYEAQSPFTMTEHLNSSPQSDGHNISSPEPELDPEQKQKQEPGPC